MAGVCSRALVFPIFSYDFLAAIYTVYTSPNHPSVPNHLPTLIVTPHGMLPSCFCDHTVHSDTLLDRQDNLPISSTRISTQTSYVPAPAYLELDLTAPCATEHRELLAHALPAR